jgi:hypothetical protein
MHKIVSYPFTQTRLHVSGTNRHPQGDVNAKEYTVGLDYNVMKGTEYLVSL